MKKIKCIICILLFLCSITTFAQHFEGKLIEAPPEHRLALDTLFSQYELYQLDRFAMNDYVKKQKSAFNLNLSLGKHDWSFQLSPKSVMGEGTMIEVMAGEESRLMKNQVVNNYKGYQEKPENRSRFFISDNILNATIHEGDQKKRLYPLRDFLGERVSDDWYVLIPYQSAPINLDFGLNNKSAGDCSTPGNDCSVARVFDGDELSFERFIEMVAIADHPFYNNWKGANCTGDECVQNVISKVSSITALASDIYEDYFDVEIVINYTRVFEEPDPYPSNHTSALNLLSARWGDQYGQANECIYRDVVHLFTAKNMPVDGASFYASYICNFPYKSVCFTRCTTNEPLWYKTVAHEIGHGLGAGHIDNLCPDNCDNGNTSSLMCTYGGGTQVDEITRRNQCNMLARFLNASTECFLENRPFDEAACGQCFVDVQPEINPSFIATGCDGLDEIELSLTITNNCIAKTMDDIRLTFNTSEMELLNPGDLGDFTSIQDIGSGKFMLKKFAIDMASEEEKNFKVQMRVIENMDNEVSVSGQAKFYNDQSPHYVTFRSEFLSHEFGYDIELNGTNTISDLIADGTLDPLTNACVDMEPKTIQINDVLIVDVDYCFYNSRITMGPGAEIKVKAGDLLSLINTEVSGCNNMWKGIDVELAGELNLSGATIKDAEFAVTANTVSQIDCKRSVFENNHVGFFIPESSNNQARNVHVNSFYGNRFDTDGAFLDPYPGQSSETDITYAGVLAYDVNVLNIKGVITPHQLFPNVFQNMQNGIITDNTNLNISIAHFENLNWFTSSGGSEAVQVTGDGNDWLIIEPTPIGGTYTTFETCRTGIQAIGMNLDIFETNMDDVYIGIDVSLSPNREIIIHENQINATNTGVNIYQCAPVSGTVEGNYITMSASTLAAGIRVNENTQSNSGWAFQNNFINLEKGRYGIYHRSGRNSAISNNTIFVTSPSIKKYDGIYMTGSPQCLINCNEIDGNGKNTTTKYRGIGIQIRNSRESIVTCNNVNRSNIGINYWLNCVHNEFSGNTIRDHQIGFLLGHIYANGSTNGTVTFSDQIHTGNRWPLLNGGEVDGDYDCIGARNLASASDPGYPGGLRVDGFENIQFLPSFESELDTWIQNISDEVPTAQCEDIGACPNGIGIYFTDNDDDDDEVDERSEQLSPLQAQNDREIKSIINATIARESTGFSQKELETLKAIAIQCPIEGGNAVYEARSILSVVESIDYDDFALCRGQKESTESAGKSLTQEDIIQVFPNPAKDFITVHFPIVENDKTDLILVNTMGQVQASIKLKEGTGNKDVNVSSFSSGVYLLIYAVDNEYLETEEVIILK